MVQQQLDDAAEAARLALLAVLLLAILLLAVAATHIFWQRLGLLRSFACVHA